MWENPSRSGKFQRIPYYLFIFLPQTCLKFRRLFLCLNALSCWHVIFWLDICVNEQFQQSHQCLLGRERFESAEVFLTFQLSSGWANKALMKAYTRWILRQEIWCKFDSKNSKQVKLLNENPILQQNLFLNMQIVMVLIKIILDCFTKILCIVVGYSTKTMRWLVNVYSPLIK